MREISNWRQILRQNFNKWDKLADFLELEKSDRQMILQNPRFVLNLPVRIANKIKKGTLNDPLLKQFLPTLEENKEYLGFNGDPVQDQSFCKTTKLLQKYKGRALLVCSSACAMHCRFCFRQNFDYDTQKHGFDEEIRHIAEDPSISEIILSGGDPLSLSNEILAQLINDLVKITHIRRIRFHTRFPIGIPERIDDEFLEILKKCPIQIWFVIHCNHPQELDEDILKCLKSISKLGIPVMNQAVLLRGVNDHLDVLNELCETLVNNGIMPYYLHQLDRVNGAGHFEVEQQKGVELIAALSAQISGYAVPRYVAEIPKMSGKTALS